MNAKKVDKIATIVIYCLVSIVVLILASLLGFVLVAGLPHINWHFLTSSASAFNAGGGIADQLFNSLYLLILTMIISLPIALLAGIYLAEYAPKNWFTEAIKVMIEVLSSLPSVVVGLFVFLLFVVRFQMGFSILSGAIALTFFNLPLLTRSIETSLSNVSSLQRQAGLSLGLSRWKTVTKIILPSALPGIITGIILSAGRVFGEAAALIFTAGQSSPKLDFANWNPMIANSPLNIFRPAETLAVHIWKINAEGVMSDASAVSAGASAVLILVVLFFNLTARKVGEIIYQKMTASR